MKKLMYILVGMSFLFGCSNHQVFSAKNIENRNIIDIQKIDWHEVSVPTSFSVHFSNKTQYLRNNKFSSPVYGFYFEVSEPKSTIEVSSIIKGLSVFSPSLALYDQDFNLLKNYNSSYFRYDRNDFIKGDALFGEVELNLENSISRVYGVLYTTEEDISENTQLLHPAKAMAIAKRTVEPAIDDPIAQHSDIGEVRVVIRKENILSGIIKNSKSASSPEVPNIISNKKIIKKIQPETERFYHKSIKLAVGIDDISKALNLLEEAKSLGISNAEDTFIKALKNKE
ncbi:MalM family protein [Vibrio cincinnatiensis]|uniref:MalM family protein n=1 Tax=Vibrio cincinnatiensis TaxID=675 RepID=UPI0038AA118A